MKEIGRNEWDTISKINNFDLMFKSEYLEIVSLSFKAENKYLILNENSQLVLAICIFYKNGKIFMPDNYSYAPLWLDKNNSERKVNQYLDKLIIYLKHNFRKIYLKLNCDINDIRIFKWNGFSVETKYTYIRFQNTPHHKSIKARLSRGNKLLPNVSKKNPTTNEIDVNINFLKNINFNQKSLRNYKIFLLNLNELGCLKSFSIESEAGIVFSFLVLIDEFKKKAFTLMINGADRGNEYFHALIYKEMLKWLDDNNFEFVDFCGANMKGISEFKSYFNPQLTSYYIVKYSRFQKFIFPFIKLINKL